MVDRADDGQEKTLDSPEIRRFRDELRAEAEAITVSPGLLAGARDRERRYRRRRQQQWRAVASGIAAAVAMVALWAWLPHPAERTPPAAGSSAAAEVFTFEVPTGWTRSGEQGRRVELRPAEANGSFVTVEQTTVPFDATADRTRWVDWVRTAGEKANVGGYAQFDPEARFGGKTVVHYREQQPGMYVDWYLLAEGTAQVFVGCQYVASGSFERARAACEQVVTSLRIAP